MSGVKNLQQSLGNRLWSLYCQLRDLRTDLHIVVFESDDWGSIRMSNKNDWDELLKMGYAVDKRPYERFDTLESAEDLEALFEVLSKYKDVKGNHPVITANMLMANPDFEKIEKSGFQEYHYEPISNTYSRYYGNSKVIDLMSQGMADGVFMPQSHGREHFDVASWMKGLQAGDEDLLTAFRFGMCGIAPKAHPEQGNNMMVALRAKTAEEQKAVGEMVEEGLNMFEQLWGFKSRSFIAPCYTWNDNIEEVLKKNGVDLVQSDRFQRYPGSSKRIGHYAGQRKDGLLFNIRNCKFEPATNEGGADLGSLMEYVDSIFAQRKIVVFSTHRINYVGGIDERNRSRTLELLDDFLTALLRKYPDTLFLSSDKLIEIFEK